MLVIVSEFCERDDPGATRYASKAKFDSTSVRKADNRDHAGPTSHLAGAELDQIQFLLARPVQTTERHVRYKQKLRHAVNDSIQLEGA
jgi:hypothetical protein